MGEEKGDPRSAQQSRDGDEAGEWDFFLQKCGWMWFHKSGRSLTLNIKKVHNTEGPLNFRTRSKGDHGEYYFVVLLLPTGLNINTTRSMGILSLGWGSRNKNKTKTAFHSIIEYYKHRQIWNEYVNKVSYTMSIRIQYTSQCILFTYRCFKELVWLPARGSLSCSPSKQRGKRRSKS